MVSKELVSNLRHAFLDKLKSEGLTEDDFHKADIYKININDDWLTRFLMQHEEQIPEALNMLWETVTWRKENNVNDINENTVNQDFLKDGSMYLHGQDIDGKTLLIFKCKMHIKGQKDWEQNKRCIIYWFERAERLNKGDKITIFFDMAESGLANMDMEYTKYLIGLCKQYYPVFLNYILIFEMPWVMNAAFKIIKSWLPPKAVEKIKFVNKSTLKDYVQPKYALTCWGGEDTYVFEFVPEEVVSSPAANDTIAMKRVHFVDGSPGDARSMASSSLCSADDDNQFIVTPLTKLRISPLDCVQFKKENTGEIQGTISIVNNNTRSIAFKIKTTAPDKFRVRPGSGVLNPEDRISVTVSLHDGVPARDVLGDKFLVMSTLLDAQDPDSSTDLVVLWKNVATSAVDQYRLKCSVQLLDSISLATYSSGVGEKLNNCSTVWRGPIEMNSGTSGHLIHAVQTLNEDNKVLKKQLQLHQTLLILILTLMIVLIAIVGYTLLNSPHEVPASTMLCDTPPTVKVEL